MAKLCIADLDNLNFGFVCDYLYKYNNRLSRAYGNDSGTSNKEEIIEANQADFNNF